MNVIENQQGNQARMNNPETPAALGTRHRTKKSKHITEKMNNTDPTYKSGKDQMLAKDKQFLFLIRNLMCYS